MALSKTNYAEIQKNEIDALRSIYMDDFEDSEVKTGAWNKTADRSFRLRLKSLSGGDEELGIILSISLPTTYPKSLPICNVDHGERLGERPKERIAELLKSKPPTLLGSEMVFELASSIQEILEDAAQLDAKFVPTLDEERAIQEAAAQQETQKAAEERQKQVREAGVEEERLLARMVEQEKARLAKQKSRSGVDESHEDRDDIAETDSLVFDRQVTVKDRDSLSISFRTVHKKAKFRNGPVTTVSTVNPSGLQEDAIPFLVLKESTLLDIEGDDTVKRGVQIVESKLETLMNLAAHPSILRPLSFRIEKTGKKWNISVLSELAGRGSLFDLLETVGTLGAGNARSWIIQLIEGLDFYHRHGIAHGDIHPQNILLDRAETGTIVAKLSDGFYQCDLHKLHRGESSHYASAVSTHWSAPEEFGRPLGKAAISKDIWDLGVILLQMLFGLDVQSSYASPSALIDGLALTRSLEDLLDHMFNANPKKRATAFDLLPFEFLRTDDPILEQRSSPSLSRMESSMSMTPSKPIRSRHDSNNFNPGSTSRYENDFVESGRLGRGGFGEVVRARNKLDGRFYAIKKISQTSASALSGVLSEIILLSRLNHPYVVRYFTAWIEDEGYHLDGNDTPSDTANEVSPMGESTFDFSNSTPGLDFISSSGYPKIEFGYESEDEGQDSEAIGDDDEGDAEDKSTVTKPIGNKAQALLERRRSSSHVQVLKTTLYIQMEYCERHTLRDLIRGDLHNNVDECWRLFHQILEGLAHVHGNGIIHRDLKPDNIFIDVTNNCRIGDFGLARPGDYQGPAKSTPSDQTNRNLTRSIGTAFYVAPEVRSANTGNYNEKADMYSLGVILFEMTFQLVTAMERAQALGKLREREHELPPAFADPEKAIQGDIINSLVSHKPSDRPGSSELLRSGKIPIQIEDETMKMALQGISDPSSTYHSKIINALFARPCNEASFKDYTFDMATSSSLEARDSLLQSTVKEKLVHIFRRHGAVESRKPLLLPNSSYYSNTAARFLNASGSLVQLPYDLTLPNARALAKQQSVPLKTFTFGDVYRETFIGRHPRSHGEVDFDIVSRDNLDLALREAEVLKVIDETIDAFPSLTSVQMCYHISHSRLLDSIMLFCDIAEAKRPVVKEIISKLNIGQWTWTKIRNELRAPSVGIASTSLDDLMRFDFRDSYEKAIPKLRSILQNTEHLESTFSHLHAVTTYLGRFQVKRKVYINPLSSFNERFYRGNILFQCLYDTKRRDVFAAGGRYDWLIQDHRPNISNEARHAVGFNLGWERLFTSMSQHLRKPAKLFIKGDQNHINNEWAPRQCDVLVDSSDPAVLRSSGVKVIQELWTNNIRAELSVDSSAKGELSKNGEGDDSQYSWIVTVKSDELVTVRNVARNLPRIQSQDVWASELVGWLRSEIYTREKMEAGALGRSRLLRRPSQQDSNSTSDRDFNVKVLSSTTKTKKTNRRTIVEDAQTRTQELLHSLADGPIAAIELKDDIFDSIRETRLSDPDTWRKLIQNSPLTERTYLGAVHKLLSDIADEANGSTKHAFVYNFRTRACFYYDLT